MFDVYVGYTECLKHKSNAFHCTKLYLPSTCLHHSISIYMLLSFLNLHHHSLSNVSQPLGFGLSSGSTGQSFWFGPQATSLLPCSSCCLLHWSKLRSVIFVFVMALYDFALSYTIIILNLRLFSTLECSF